MKNQWESLLEGQQKMMEYWTEMSKKVMETFSENMPTEKKGDEKYLSEWFEKQKSFFEEAARVANPQEALEKWPEQFKSFMGIQAHLAEYWTEFYRDSAQKMGLNVPELNGNSPVKLFEKGWELWNRQLKEGTDFMQKGLMGKLPSAMQPHYKNFLTMYQDMFQYWDPIQRMMRMGVFEKTAIDSFFSPEKYQDMINKLMGFQFPGDTDSMLKNANALFDKYIEFIQMGAPNILQFQDTWEKYFGQLGASQINPVLQATMDINHRIKEAIEPYLHMMGQGKEADTVKIMKDLQFAYTGFLVKSTEMQSRIYQAGQFALPDTIKMYYKAYREGKDLPDFDAFFHQYLTELENYITEVMESKEYSELQSEVAALGVTVKKKLDDLIELNYKDTPFLMKSHGDDIALETNALRKKIRDLENRIKEMEKSSSTTIKTTTTASSKKKVKPSTTDN